MNMDAWRDPEREVRILVESLKELGSVRDQYIIRHRSLRVLWHYWRHVGLLHVIRKIRSRLAEGRRNEKVAAFGVGTVIEAPTALGVSPGERVVFFAPSMPSNSRCICVDIRLAKSAGHCVDRSLEPAEGAESIQRLRSYYGWSPWSGAEIDARLIERGLCALLAKSPEMLQAASVARSEIVSKIPVDRVDVPRKLTTKPTAVVFGLGNYSKTQIIPNIRRRLELACVHEVDPDQIAAARAWGVTLDTCPWPRPDERYDAWFIAGYHHTHAELAVHALTLGAYAVVEKPLVTTRAQLQKLSDAVALSDATKLFACFHRRYSRLNEWAREDLRAGKGVGIDMHCIVYEIPLPTLHWYNWPSSGSRLVSNACHWLDYFMFMNEYAPVTDMNLVPLRGRDLAVTVQLANDAHMVMSLTDRGSGRIGVREVVELRKENVTVRIVDARHYDSESSFRVLRRGSVDPYEAFHRMYASISGKIAAGLQGDPVSSLRSTELVIALEERSNAAIDNGGGDPV